MNDPSFIPGWLAWVGLVISVSGAVLAMHGFGQRRPSWIADLGGAIVALGFVLMLGTALTNGVGALAYWLHGEAEKSHVRYQYQSPDH